jgi:tyrosinase
MVHRTAGLQRFLSRLALSGLVLTGLPAVAGAAAPPTAAPPRAAVAPRPTSILPPLTVVHVRKEISSFTSAQVDAYRKGVALMQSRAFNDPTSWTYQANMHGFPTTNAVCPVIGTPQPNWSTCQHGSFFFLAWHRMYLYYFERILRASVRQAIGNPTYEFNLPFWNYEDPNLRTLPKPFRDPANTATNSLYVQKRSSNCNAGQPCISAADASDTAAMGLTPFCSGPGGSAGAGCTSGISSDESFGGGFVSAPTHSGSGPGELELQPHGVVHNAVGGPGGWMSYFTCAARDPIFWLHHANIDRLWQKWLNQGGRKNPIANGEWTKQTFTFYDENKKPVTMTACQILNMATQLNYRYDGVPVNNVVLCSPTITAAPQIESVTPLKVVAASPAAETRLRDAPVSVDITLPAQTEAAPGPAKKTRLAVEGVKILTPGSVYQVYLNLPEGKKADPAGPYFLGNISIFGEPEHTGEVTRSFDISSKIQALRKKGGKVHLTFVREQLGTGAHIEAAQDFLSFKRVSIVEH